MSFLFHHKTQKAINIVWKVVAIVVALGMVLFFAPGITNLLASL